MPTKLKDHGLNIDTFKFHSDASIPNVKELLNSTGCGFCLAKFRQITLHLGTGKIHSCHHPTPHNIPLEEIADDPLRLLNTTVLKRARTQMLNNEKPVECDYCWRVEDNGSNSDRILKSKESWALSDHDMITELDGSENIYPTYLEVSFSNACNQSCLYCGPEYSSKWVEELKAHGPVVLFPELGKENVWAQGWQDLNSLSYKNREHNPYIEAFWKIFPDVVKHLKHYRITGGEPLMSKETFKTMDWFIEHPNLDLEVSINSNLSVPDKIWIAFTDRLKLLRHNCVKKVTIYTSIEGWGERAEYARQGLDFQLFKLRVEELSAMANIRVVIMSTFNIFSITSFKQMLEWICDLKKQHNPSEVQVLEKDTGFNLATQEFRDRRDNNPSHSVVVGLDIPYLRQPEYLDAQFCTHELVEEYLLPSLDYMSRNVANLSWINAHQGFDQHEFEKFKRIVLHRINYNKKSNPDRDSESPIIRNRAAFFDFVNEMDKRRNTNFLATFPEMQRFYDQCAAAKTAYVQRSC